MRVDKVPPPGDPARLGLYDPDERFTFRKPARDMPSAALEEVLSAEILKSAKEKFNARPWAQPSASSEEEEADTDSEGGSEDEVSDGATVKSPLSTKSKKSASRSRSRPRSVKPELMSEDEQMDDVDKHHPEDDELHKKRHFQPTVSTDDDLSYNLLRPSVRHIMTKLDTTLTVLHNAQEATLINQSDSGDSESDASSLRSARPPSRQGRRNSVTGSGKKGRPLGSVSHTHSRRRSISQAPEPERKKVGRPRKVYPRLEGETDREYKIRVARIQKKPIPVFSDEEPDPQQEPGSSADESDPGRESGNSGDGEETEGPGRVRVKKRKRVTAAATRGQRSPSAASSASANRRGPRRIRARTRVGLRDWRDVLGAAALAGFPAAAVDRAARRCADLFGQSMTLQTLIEGPVTSGRKPAARVTTYVPGMPQPPLLEDDEEEGEQRIPIRGTRTPSLAPGATSETETSPSQTRRRSRSVSQARSRSGSASGSSSYLCTFQDCPRAAFGEGFSRRNNLLRHLKLVHGLTPSELGGGGPGDGGQSVAASAMLIPDEVDSEDEMYGAVHVDWYLKPIRLQQGWRGADAEEPKKKKSGHGRGRGRPRKGSETGVATDEDGDVRMGEDD